MPRILIVDDSPTEVFKISQILTQNGFAVLTAENGEQGMDIAKREVPDLVLMDVVMPGLNGSQTTLQLSRDPQTSGIPVIIRAAKIFSLFVLRVCAMVRLRKTLKSVRSQSFMALARSKNCPILPWH
jgi:twitching motility two-component system response regulator PilH